MDFLLRMSERMERYGCTLLTDVYMGARTKVKFRCACGRESLKLPPGPNISYYRCGKCGAAETGRKVGKRLKGRKVERTLFHQFVADSFLAGRRDKIVQNTFTTSEKDFLTLECLNHGKFKLRRAAYGIGGMCPQCSSEAKQLTLTRKRADLYPQYVADMFNHPRGKYRYSKRKFIEGKRIEFYCLKHAKWFNQNKYDHRNGDGCPECKADAVSRRFRTPLSDTLAKLAYLGIVPLDKDITLEGTMQYRCECGEIHKRSVKGTLEAGGRCPDSRGLNISKGKLQKFEGVWLTYAENNCELLSKSYTGPKQQLRFKCTCGNIHSKTFSEFKAKPRCYECGRALIWKGRRTPNFLGLASLSTYEDRLKKFGVPTRDGENDFLEVQCYRDGCYEWFTPTVTEVISKLTAAKGLKLGESNLYCSAGCKCDCKVHNFKPGIMVDPDSKLYVPKTVTEEVRACARTDRRELMRLQIDEFGYTYCDRCGTITKEIEHHHTQEVAKTGRDAITAAGHMLLCIDCHKEFTSTCRK